MKYWLLWAIFTILAGISTANAQPISCDGPYKGQTLTHQSIQSILTAHEVWLSKGGKASDPGRANLCDTHLIGLTLNGRNLSYANLSGSDLTGAQLRDSNLSHTRSLKTYFRNANLSRADLQNANLEEASFENATLNVANFQQAILIRANFTNANLSGANLRSANLTGANLTDADLSGTDLRFANLSHADLEQANLTGAILLNANLEGANLTRANLTNADFEETNLVNANLTHSIIKDASFAGADFKGAIFQPALKGLPKLIALATSRNFQSVRFPKKEGVAALIELRAAYKAVGLRAMERRITAMVKTEQMRKAWQSGGWGYVESAINYILFYITCDFGASPGRPLRILVILIFLLCIPYRFALSSKSLRSGIVATWKTKRFYRGAKPQDTERRKELSKMLVRHRVHGFRAQLKEQWRLIRVALYFSFLSSFTLGWRELNVSNWVLRLQSRASVLRGTGWVRVLAGFQSLVSAYLVVLWALTYFGSPFEW